jgi:hypothetical protein
MNKQGKIDLKAMLADALLVLLGGCVAALAIYVISLF